MAGCVGLLEYIIYDILHNLILCTKLLPTCCTIAIGALDYLVGLSVNVIYLGLDLIISGAKGLATICTNTIAALDNGTGKV